MLPDRVSNPGPLTYESGALPIALRGPAPTLSVLVLRLICGIGFRIIVLHFTSNYVIGIKVHVAKRLNNGNRSSEIKYCFVGCFGLSGPLRQYFSLYRYVSQRAR